MTQEILGSFLAQTAVGVAFEVMGPCENEKAASAGMGTFADWEPIARRIAAGQNRARAVRTGHRWPKKARELYAGRHVWRFLAKNPAPAVPWGRNPRDRRHPRAEFPQFRMPLQRGVRARDSGPRGESLENSSPRAIFGQLARATRGVHERRLNFGSRAEFSGMQRRKRRGRARVGGPIARGEGRPGSPSGPLGGPIVLRRLDEQRNDKGRNGHGEEEPRRQPR